MQNKINRGIDLNLKYSPSVASLPAVPVLVRIHAGKAEMRSSTNKLSFGSIHGSIQWQSVCPHKSHWSATKSSLSHRGLCLWPKASPDRWCSPENWQGDCLAQRNSVGNTSKYILSIQSTHTKPHISLLVSFFPPCVFIDMTWCLTIICFYSRIITSQHKSDLHDPMI